MVRNLASIDASAYAPSICDHAAWIATRTGGSVQVLHVIARSESSRPHLDLSGSIGLGARSSLLEDLTLADEAHGRLAQEHGRAMLDGAQRRLLDAGVREVTTLHRHGDVAETIIEIEAAADLVVIGKRGEGGNYSPGHLGGKVERVVRESIKPILVTPRVFMPITRVVLAFDGGPSANRALEHLAASKAFANVPYHVVVIGEPGPQTAARVQAAADRLAGRPDTTVEAVSGDVESGLKSRLRHGQGDLLAMGAYGHSRIRELIVGSTTTTMLRTVKIPLLLFR